MLDVWGPRIKAEQHGNFERGWSGPPQDPALHAQPSTQSTQTPKTKTPRPSLNLHPWPQALGLACRNLPQDAPGPSNPNSVCPYTYIIVFSPYICIYLCKAPNPPQQCLGSLKLDFHMQGFRFEGWAREVLTLRPKSKTMSFMPYTLGTAPIQQHFGDDYISSYIALNITSIV